MKCSLCNKETSIIQLIENIGSCNKCIGRKPYHPTFEDGLGFGFIIGFTAVYLLLRMGLL